MTPPDDTDKAEIYVEVRKQLLFSLKLAPEKFKNFDILCYTSINLHPTFQGKRKLVDGFVRWCKRGNVGLSQVVGVEEILEEEPTGLYDGFYVKTK